MSSAPVLGSYTITDMGSNKAWRVTIDRPQASSEPGDTTAPVEPAAAVQSVDTVQISREALARYHAHAIDRIKAGQTATNPVTLSAGTLIEDPNALSEEEHQALITSLNKDPLQRAMEELAQRDKVLVSAYKDMNQASASLEETYVSLLKDMMKYQPDLRHASFGFSVNAERQIVLTRVEGLTNAQTDRLLQTLRGSSTLVEQANELADAQIAVFEAERFHVGYIDFNRDTYAKTIDISDEILSRVIARSAPRDGDAGGLHQKNWDNNWRQQVWAKGERVRG